MSSHTAQQPPEGEGRRRLRPLAVLVGLGTAVLLSTTLALAISSRHQVNGSAQTATTTPAPTPWATPTLPPLQYPKLVWVDSTGKALPALPSGTITTSCTRNNFTVHVTPEAPSYPRGVPVVFKESVVFTGPNPCFIAGDPTPQLVVFDSAHNVVWEDTGKYAVARAHIPEGQLTAMGDALVRDYPWVQDACAITNCPGTEVPSGTYTAQLFFRPYGESAPATVQIGG
jgi:hypothetical protein